MRKTLALGVGMVLVLGVATEGMFGQNAAVQASAVRLVCLRIDGCGSRPYVVSSLSVEAKRPSRDRPTAVGLTFRGKVWVEDPQLPALRRITVDFDRRGALRLRGLPACGRRRLEATAARAASDVCRRAIVGRGRAVVVGSTERVVVPLTLFNGGRHNGIHKVFVRAANPDLSRTVVSAIKVRRLHGGPYGLRATVQVPALDEGDGFLSRWQINVRRIFRVKGSRRSYAVLKCSESPRLTARVEFRYKDYSIQTNTLSGRCKRTA